MMGRSHVALGTGALCLAVAFGSLPMTPAMLATTAFGSLAPDIDTEMSSLGRLVPFVSLPLRLAVGHRTLTHSIFAVALLGTAAFLGMLYSAEYAHLIAGFFLGYLIHIFADLLTIEGCALAYPARERYSLWPRVRTGSLAEFLVAAPLVAGMFWLAYAAAPDAVTAPYDQVRSVLRHGAFGALPRLPW
jgi:inner membrane protein